MKASLTILLLLFSHNALAASSKIVPEDKAQLIRQIGESVYVACKKAGPYSTNCQIDCGNGRRFSKASGYCYFMREGTFVLKVSTRYRNRNIHHSATVIVGNGNTDAKTPANRATPPTHQKSDSIANLSTDKAANNQSGSNVTDSHQSALQEDALLTQSLREAEDARRSIVQNELSQTSIQNGTNAFGRDSLPPSGGFTGNDVNIPDQNAGQVVLR